MLLFLWLNTLIHARIYILKLTEKCSVERDLGKTRMGWVWKGKRYKIGWYCVNSHWSVHLSVWALHRITVVYPFLLLNPFLTLFPCNLTLSSPVSAVRSRCQQLERIKWLNLGSAIGVRPPVTVVLTSVMPAAEVNEGLSISSWRDTTDHRNLCLQWLNLAAVVGIRPWAMMAPVPDASRSRLESQHQQLEKGPMTGPIYLAQATGKTRMFLFSPTLGCVHVCTCACVNMHMCARVIHY